MWPLHKQMVNVDVHIKFVPGYVYNIAYSIIKQ